MPEKNIYQKLAAARKHIREANPVKDAENSFSKYSYFTPTMVSNLVEDACEATGLLALTSLKSDERGLYQELILVDTENPREKLDIGVEPKNRLVFQLRTEKGTLKATNETQNMGSTNTYSERYIKMSVFGIVDNSMDPDANDNRKGTQPKKSNELDL